MKVTFPFFRCLVLSLQLYIFCENWKRLLPSPVPLIIDPCIIDGPSLFPHCLLLWHGRRKLTLTIVRSRRRWWHPLQYSCLANPMGGGAWWAAIHGVANSQTWLSDFAFTFTFMHWRRKWQPTPVFLPGESQGRGSLMGCRLWGCTELDTTEAT